MGAGADDLDPRAEQNDPGRDAPTDTRERPRRCPVADDLGGNLEPLEPLLAFLESNHCPSRRMDFLRGTVLPDGRLDLSGQGVGALGAEALVRAIPEGTWVRSVLLGSNHLGDSGAGAIAGLLGIGGITSLYLGHNQIGWLGASHLAEAMGAAKPTVAQGTGLALWLKRNRVGRKGVTALAGTAATGGLRTLDLVDNDLGPEDMAPLSAVLAQGPLEHLFLCGNRGGVAGTAYLAEALGEAPRLTALSLASNGMGDPGARLLAQGLSRNRTLQVLRLSNNGIGPEGISAIAEALVAHPSLCQLELGAPGMSTALGGSPNRMNDSTVLALGRLIRSAPALSSLDLTGVELTENGASLLADAVEHTQKLRTLSLGSALPAREAARINAVLCTNANRTRGATANPWVRVFAAVSSVYRANSKDLPEPPTRVAPLPLPLAGGELAVCTRVLQAIAAHGEFPSEQEQALSELFDAVRAVQRRDQRARRRSRARRTVEGDLQKLEGTGLRRAHRKRMGLALSSLEPRFLPGESVVLPREETANLPGPLGPAQAIALSRSRTCYMCRAPYHQLDPFYDALCPPCAALSRRKREQSGDLRGYRALVTGGRIKIGFSIVVRLLRAGAEVTVTTRFPFDAARRYSELPDFQELNPRLRIVGLDLRFLHDVERLPKVLGLQERPLHILIHNAAQTVARPPEFYRDQVAYEAAAIHQDLPAHSLVLCAPGLSHEALIQSSSSLSLCATPSGYFPEGSQDAFGQRVDLRAGNSWTHRLGQVSTGELLAVHAVSALSPFVLTNALLPSLRADPSGPRFVVCVSAVEGQFVRRYKGAGHPHTNMAKAALNMLVRTSAAALAEEGIYLSAVDTGWITNENPLAVAVKMQQQGFSPPLDEEEGAARVCDPIFATLAGEGPLFGAFYKDYRVAPW